MMRERLPNTMAVKTSARVSSVLWPRFTAMPFLFTLLVVTNGSNSVVDSVNSARLELSERPSLIRT